MNLAGTRDRVEATINAGIIGSLVRRRVHSHDGASKVHLLANDGHLAASRSKQGATIDDRVRIDVQVAVGRGAIGTRNGVQDGIPLVGALLACRHAIEEVLVGIAGAHQPIHSLDAATWGVGKHQRWPPQPVGTDVLKADAGLGKDQAGVVVIVRGLGVIGSQDRCQRHEAAVVKDRGINLNLVWDRSNVEVEGRRLCHQG